MTEEKQTVDDAVLDGTPAEAADEAESDATEATDEGLKSPDEAVADTEGDGA